MKNTYKFIATFALAIALAIPVMALADDGNAQTDTDTSVNTNTSITMPGELLPPPQNGDQGQGEPGPNGMPGQNGRPSIRATIRADINSRVENAQNNQDVRNMLERGTSTMPRPRPFMASTSMMMGSTTMRGRFDQDGDDNHMRQDMFEMRKRIVTKELDVALNNLNNISSRLSSRIDKEAAAGRDMSEASSSLVAANAKIQIASDAVTSLEAYLPSASSTASASTTISLDTARSLASTAQQDIKDAQRALNDVVVTIAHAMGLKLGEDSHIEATSTASTTTQ